ncbi:hypothetical protein CC80DRAFT_494034 [Byssothecium circinans]|uniref:Uncharacterized protein n=1 Tax=Byssothecium circinans TaxID=147558 RepID=A0A6A5TNI4_9PLEO|nr:hypothetical protein CC80DRAFT_494034 [Byssothecium circinans]
MKSFILITAFAFTISSVAAWGTVKLSIYPDIINLKAAEGSTVILDQGVYEAISKLCTGTIAEKDPSTGLLWHHCTTDSEITIGPPGSVIGVKVSGSAWRDDNQSLRDTLMGAVSAAWEAMGKSTDGGANRVPSKLSLQTGLKGENYLNVELVNSSTGNQDSSTNTAAAPAGNEFCNSLVAGATKALDGLMMEFNARLGGGSTTRVVQCVNDKGEEL